LALWRESLGSISSKRSAGISGGGEGSSGMAHREKDINAKMNSASAAWRRSEIAGIVLRRRSTWCGRKQHRQRGGCRRLWRGQEKAGETACGWHLWRIGRGILKVSSAASSIS